MLVISLLLFRPWFLPEVNAQQVFQRTVGVGQTKLVLSIVVGVRLKNQTAKHPCVVPKDGHA